MNASTNYDFNMSFEKLGVEERSSRLPSPNLYPGLEIGQTFVSPDPRLWRIEILPGTHNRKNRCTIYFLLRKDGPAGDIIARAQVSGASIEDNQWHSLEFPPIEESAGKRYYLSAYSPDSRIGNALIWWMNPRAALEKGNVLFNGKKREGSLCFRSFHLTSPEIWKNLQALKSLYRHPSRVAPVTPVRLVLELTTRCNLRCRMCRSWQDFAEKHKPMGDISDETFSRLLPFVSRAMLVQPTGWGEPLVHSRFFPYIEKIRQLNGGAVISINTNGMLLGPAESEKAVELEISRICVSLDSMKKEVFEHIRVGASFTRVINNIQNLIRVRDRAGKKAPRITTHMVLMENNMEELPEFTARCHELGIEEISLGTMYGSEEIRPGVFAGHLDAYRKARDYAITRKIPFYGSAVDKFETIIAGQEETERTVHEETTNLPLCCDPWETLFFEYTGNVRPCCNYLGLPVMGNTAEEAIETIWNGAEYRNLRSGFIDSRPGAHCQNCIYSLFAQGRPVLRPQRLFPMEISGIDQSNPYGLSRLTSFLQRALFPLIRRR